jgi:hypothetical protein
MAPTVITCSAGVMRCPDARAGAQRDQSHREPGVAPTEAEEVRSAAQRPEAPASPAHGRENPGRDDGYSGRPASPRGNRDHGEQHEDDQRRLDARLHAGGEHIRLAVELPRGGRR